MATRKFRTKEQRILDQEHQLEKDRREVLDTVVNRLLLARTLHEKSQSEHKKAVEAASLAINSLRVLKVDLDEFLKEFEGGALELLITELIKEKD